MAKKASEQPAKAKKGETAAPADAAPQQADAQDDLAQVEAVIDDTQRAAKSVAEGADQDAVDTVADAVSAAQDAGDTPSDSMDEIVSALEEVEGAQSAKGALASLKDYDEAIAGAVDDLLVGDFVSVDLVLEGMNESSPPPMPPASDDAESDAPDASNEPAAEVKAAAAPRPSVEAQPVSAAPSEQPATQSEHAAEPGPEPQPAHENAVDVASNEAENDLAEQTHVVADAPPKRRTPAPPQDENAEAELAGAGHEPARASSGAIYIIREFVKPAVQMGVIPILELLSLPLRFVPPKARDIIDWIALSLIFWVPIVWIFALFVVG